MVRGNFPGFFHALSASGRKPWPAVRNNEMQKRKRRSHLSGPFLTRFESRLELGLEVGVGVVGPTPALDPAGKSVCYTTRRNNVQ